MQINHHIQNYLPQKIIYMIKEKPKFIKFSEAILEALYYSLKKNNKTFLIGEGVTDPKAIFGTTKNLYKTFGKKRVLDMPVSEAGLTGIIIGAAINGMKPILMHQRVDFMLLTMDQIVNSAAKLSYIFNGQLKVPIVIRGVIGRGWGQSAQHSQSLEAVFAYFPGLKVIAPSNAIDARNLLIAAINDNNPVIFLEHRWLHDTFSKYKDIKIEKLNGPKKIKSGKELTLVGFSYTLIEILKADKLLRKIGINCEIIDLRILKPFKPKIILNSVSKTRRLLVVDNGFTEYGISSEIVTSVSEHLGKKLKSNPIRLGTLNHPTPASKSLIEGYYPNYKLIIKSVISLLNIPEKKIKAMNLMMKKEKNDLEIDVPNSEFKGPF